MDIGNNNIIYTAEDIYKYLTGKLSPAEMHAMEKAALEDAFLAEAMEGYHEMMEKDWKRQLILLKSNFEEKQTAKVIALQRPSSYALWKVAAAVILICSGVAITYMLTTKDPVTNNSISAINTKQDSANNTTNETGNDDAIPKQINPRIENTKTTEQSSVTKAHRKPGADSAFLNRPEAKKKAHLPSGNEFLADQLKDSGELATGKAPAPAQKNSLEQSETKSSKVNSQLSKDIKYFEKAEAADEETYVAQVVGTDGSPVAFANISLSNKQPATYADARGNFTIKTADSLLDVEIKSKGYISGNFTLSSGAPSTKLVLKPEAAALKEKSLDEVIVTGYGTKRKSALIADATTNVVPLDGWDNYDKYLSNNLFLSNNIVQKKIHGEVIVSFEVQIDGTLKNVKIEKSLCDDCDESALRLIKEGPAWKLLNRNNASGKVKVKF